jgi:hypothetical protein
MATCRANKPLKLGGELNCDLDEHDAILNFHYDKAEDVEWRADHQPAPVPYTPTGPIPKLVESK